MAVIGPGATARADEIAAAREVGRLLAELGAVVLTGGLGGVMAAAAAGARDAGGTSVGLLPGRERDSGDAAHTVLLPTGLGELRNALLVNACDGVVVIGGSWGTLSELALAMRSAVPVVCLGGWAVTDASGEAVPMTVAATPAAAVNQLLHSVQKA